jgi:hypothetical protein
LRPLNNLLWSYVQDESNRLTERRRAYEYTHQYGLTLYGKATSRLETFHNLIQQSSIFFEEDFTEDLPLLDAVKEVHLMLAQGAHNQFGDLPWTARVEMMLMQYILARPEIRDFLQSRTTVP